MNNDPGINMIGKLANELNSNDAVSIAAQRRHAPVEDKQRKNIIRKTCIWLATNKYYDRIIIIAVIANSGILGIYDFTVVDDELNPTSTGVKYVNGELVPAYSSRNAIAQSLETLFTLIFTMESAIRIVAMGFVFGKGSYLPDTWNLLNFAVVISSIVAGLPSVPNVSVIRTIRVLRSLRSLTVIPGMRRLITALLKALLALRNVVILQIFVFFIFGILGIQLFGGGMNRRCRLTEFVKMYYDNLFAKVALTDNIDTHANFQRFWTSMLFMMWAATGEAWDYCMHDLASNADGCVDDPSYDPTMCGFHNFEGCIPINGCGNSIAIPYFTSFTLLVTYVMLNVTIAVILEGFSQSKVDEEPLFEPDLLDEFQKKWAEIDEKATGFISVRKILVLINRLEAPLGKYGVAMNARILTSYLRKLDLPLYEGESIHFKDVLLAMTREMVKELRRILEKSQRHAQLRTRNQVVCE